MPNDTEGYHADSFDNMKAFATTHRFTFPYVIDETQEVARTYGAHCTPDFPAQRKTVPALIQVTRYNIGLQFMRGRGG